jgi:hypothetical protein
MSDADKVISAIQEPVIFKEVQKRTRLMTPEMLEKLALARIKAVARKKELSGAGNQLKIDYLQAKMDKIKTVKEAKVVVPIEVEKKKRTQKKPVEVKQEVKPAEIDELDDDEEEEVVTKPPPTPPLLVRQAKKKIIIEESLSEAEDQETEIVYVRKPKISIRPRVPFKQDHPTTKELPKIIQPIFGRRF